MHYLLKPPASIHAPRHGAAIAVLVLYFLLFLLIAVTYFHLLYTVMAQPGYVERSELWLRKQEGKGSASREKHRSRRRPSEKDSSMDNDLEATAYTETNAIGDPSNEERPSLQDFFKHDVFTCQGDGRPTWCSTCLNWKPDRAHHCREVDRCVRKMDHFCPWVGGVVSETSFKFFVQFVAWAAVYWLFILVTMAIFLAEYIEKTGTINVHWVVTLAFAALFFLFTAGMTGSSMQFVLLNTTTIENLSRKSVVYQLAIHIPRPSSEPPPYPTISYSTASKPIGQIAPDAIKTFAILHSKPGQNPWDLGAFENFKNVMGYHWYDWLLPLHHSPCSRHDGYGSQFATGPVVEDMKREAGIGQEDIREKPHSKRRRRKRRRHSTRDDAVNTKLTP